MGLTQHAYLLTSGHRDREGREIVGVGGFKKHEQSQMKRKRPYMRKLKYRKHKTTEKLSSGIRY
jgi:hypothetical protein